MLNLSRCKSPAVISPFLPNSKITDNANINGGEINGNNTIDLNAFCPIIFVLVCAKANINPINVENVATINPRIILFLIADLNLPCLKIGSQSSQHPLVLRYLYLNDLLSHLIVLVSI